MVTIPKIQSSTKYDSFQFIKGNRPVSEKHVTLLASDPTFPEKFPTCPAVVNSDLEIIDGQHRFCAAKLLNIPFYYVVDYSADDQDIVRRNSQMKDWTLKSFVGFYAQKGNESYKMIQDLMEKHEITLSYLNSLIIKLGNFRQIAFTYKFRQGNIKLNHIKNELPELCEKIFPVLKKCTTIKGNFATRPLFTSPYLYGYAHYFKNEPKILDRFLEKILIAGLDFPYCGSFESARQQIKKISNWKRPPQ